MRDVSEADPPPKRAIAKLGTPAEVGWGWGGTEVVTRTFAQPKKKKKIGDHRQKCDLGITTGSRKERRLILTKVFRLYKCALWL